MLKGQPGNAGPKALGGHQAHGKRCHAAHCGVVQPVWPSGEFDRGDSLSQMVYDVVCFHPC